MALVAGDVTVSDVGVRTGSDLALVLYDEQAAALTEISNPPPKGGPVATKQSLARFCNHLALALAPYINANITGGGGGGSGDVTGPSSAVTLDIAIFNGTTGKIIKDSGVSIAALTAALQAYADGVGASVLTLASNDLLLVAEPSDPDTTYSNTLSGLQVTQEKWVRTSGGARLKQIDYTYTGLKLTTEVRKVYASDGTTIVAELTLNYTYTGLTLTGETAVRNI